MEEGVEQAGLVRRAGEAAIAESGRKAGAYRIWQLSDTLITFVR